MFGAETMAGPVFLASLILKTRTAPPSTMHESMLKISLLGEVVHCPLIPHLHPHPHFAGDVGGSAHG